MLGFKQKLQSQVHKPGRLRLQGGDISNEAVLGAIHNAKVAGVADWIEFERGDAFDYQARPGWNAWMISNLPYGVRVGDPEEIEDLHRRFGAQLRQDCKGYHASLLTGDRRLAHSLGFEKWDQVPLRNGSLRCTLVSTKL